MHVLYNIIIDNPRSFFFDNLFFQKYILYIKLIFNKAFIINNWFKYLEL
jgi:hypothetical protein